MVYKVLPEVTIYTDGSCQPNPGHGAWAALLVFVVPSTGEVVEREISGYEHQTTSVRMEIAAAVYALRALKGPCVVTLHSDSLLVVNCGPKRWKRKANLDLWAQFDEAARGHELTTKHVKGHSGHSENERVDQLAEKTRLAGRGSWVPIGKPPPNNRGTEIEQLRIAQHADMLGDRDRMIDRPTPRFRSKVKRS
jgi:ribonuclease HI